MTTSLDIRAEVKNFYITIPDNWKRYFINWVEYLPKERTYEQWLLEAISYIWQDQWREESEDIYRKHFWLPTLYDKHNLWKEKKS